ncbi:MAG TPA: glucose-6-phosphate dehydrogenase [Acidimicrobiia bacterium]|nr:glucose-6-phosphate dehydrogenase [Acidimicrobiia bacterium]
MDRHLFVVLGATGDLTTRKLLPALYDLMRSDAAACIVLGGATRPLGDDGYRTVAVDALTGAGVAKAAAASWTADHVFYERVERDGPYDALARRIAGLEADLDLPGNRVLYLAVPPEIVPDAVARLGAAGLADSPGWTRLVVEKPFGRDLASARDLNRLIHSHFPEDAVYRIDHYLGKETVQNLLVFRFGNPIFESSWNRDRIERVEITVAESIGVGTRGAHYDDIGVLRDMVQSHLTQILTLVAMESPTDFTAGDVRDEKVKVLRSVHPIDPDHVVLGQYRSGADAGSDLADYRDAGGVEPGSTTPTFAAIRLSIDNWRWQGVPFLLRTGKGLARRQTQVAVTFRSPPVCLFHGAPDGCMSEGNVLCVTLQPDEGFSLVIEVKEPGDPFRLRRIPLHFSYADAFGEIPDAYATLLTDVIEGDPTLFVRADEVEESWRLYTPLLGPDLPVHPYEAGGWGPDEALRLLDGGHWATGE